MNGLDKIIEKILTDAEEAAALTRQQADAEIAAINEESAKVMERIVAIIEAQTEKEEAQIRFRSESAAAMARRNALLDAKSKVMDEAYAAAIKFFLDLPSAEYAVLLVKILAGTVQERVCDIERMRAYGETFIGEADSLPFEVILNEKDQKNLGGSLLIALRKEYADAISSSILDKITISDSTVDITGGLILRHGDIEANCSLELLVEQIRPVLDAQVYETLFS